MIDPDLRARIDAWIADDPDERDQAELRALLASGSPAAEAELADRFGGRLEFGTAGLRGAVAAGPNRMNRAVVRGATAALAGWLRARGGGGPPNPVDVTVSGSAAAEPHLHRHPAAIRGGVVIGCDARHRSDEFADEAARVLAGAGLRVHLLPPRQPTPLLAFSIRQLSASAGIMITASHNPPADNGYKLYLSDGVQIIPPADAEIEAAIRALGPLAQVPVAAADSPLITRHGDEVARAYLDEVTAPFHAPTGAAGLRFVYTPLHGVAGGLALRAFRQAGFRPPDVVAAQAAPDPDFPTVSFPNPEEPGALDMALAQARQSGADLVVATTVVSGTMLASIAAWAGARYAETLTGFKWIVRAADQRDGLHFVYGYEEALGYTIGTVVRDKDGIGAALATLSLAARARSGGESLLDAYDTLEVAHGVHLTSQLTLRTSAPAEVMARLRAVPPAAFGALDVISTADLAAGTAELPPADVLSYRLAGGRVVIRPSGTEPKIKAYLEVVEPVSSGRLAETRRAAQARMDPLRAAVRALLQG